MGFIGKIVSGITSSLGNIAKTALKAVAPKVTDLLKNIVGSGFDGLKGMAQKLVGNLPGPFGKIAEGLVGKGFDFLKGLSQDALGKALQGLLSKVLPQEVPGAPGVTVNTPAMGTAAGAAQRAQGAHAATGAVDSTIQQTTGTRPAPAGNTYEDQLAAGAAGAKEPEHKTAAQLDKMTEGEMIAYQEQMQKHARLMDMYSKLIQAQNDMKKGIIANFRV